ncbi:nitrate ABC transporter ATP-binding protein [Gimibacter soli]|uniref:Nitrate ABC transporter ATP-binding protein n=1 Tax=Gimibacter soli TaxID=3024400 RepID=A0AAE9XQR0_9PROT|nr:nitrate ABC transporter ATP-binding protein [Gimibacter soli]WCL53361.1 nitrate ABC transporter ATP-binding protein [Gimibacter soli]
MAHLELKDVAFSYGKGRGRTPVLRDINLAIEEGEFLAIVGFSGAGKTSLISLISGLVKPERGSITMNGTPVTGPGPDRGVVFQNYSLMPWLTVAGNIALAVDSLFGTEDKVARQARVDRYIDMVGLTHARDRKPHELSGGMRQRVAVARALAMDPEILLLDEPLSALDALTRAKLQDELDAIRAKDRKTVILITNDVDEAILLADRIIPLTPGPEATLGPAFKVDIPRPRLRSAMNHDAGFVKLRADVTSFLIEAEKGANAARQAAEGILPTIAPIEIGRAPKAYREAAASPRVDRYVEFSQISKVYDTPKGPLTIVDGFDLKMKKGEFITLIGHSGCGKSTVLNMAAGLTSISAGGVILDGRQVISTGPERAVVFQAPSLMPWLTAFQNVALGVNRVYPHATAAEKRDVIEYYLARVGLGDAMHKPAAEMSNGMRQRVGIARAFALSPKLLLLDEPFGMLDSLTRWALQEVLMDVWARTQVTAICVTHDVDEAILLADRCVMMSNGPNAKIGNIMEIDIPRPRRRRDLVGHPKYYEYREELLSFLEAYEHGDPADAESKPTPKRRTAA